MLAIWAILFCVSKFFFFSTVYIATFLESFCIYDWALLQAFFIGFEIMSWRLAGEKVTHTGSKTVYVFVWALFQGCFM